MDYKKKIAELIKSQVELDLEKIEQLIEIPPKPEMGDYAFPCFQLAKSMRKAPNMIAEELKDKFDKEGFERIENLGPYVNFFVDKGNFTKNTIEKVLTDLATNLKGKIKDATGDIEILGINRLADSAVEYRVTVPVKPMKQFETERFLRKEIKDAFDKSGINIPYPQIEVHNGK